MGDYNLNLYCRSCRDSPEYDNNTCVDVCGDTILGYQDCDEGLGNSFDGCTDLCEVEDNFICTITIVDIKSVCSYEGSFNYSFVSYKKEQFENKITAIFQVYPPLFLFTQVDPNNFMFLDQTLCKDTSFVYDQSADQFSVTFSYSTNIT